MPLFFGCDGMSVEAPARSRPMEAASTAPQHATNQMLMDPYRGMGRVTVVAGLEDTLAALRTAVLLARNFRATLHLVVLEAERLQIHFGPTSCHALLLGLLDLVQGRLNKSSSVSSANFVIEIGILSDLHSILIHIHTADSVRSQLRNGI